MKKALCIFFAVLMTVLSGCSIAQKENTKSTESYDKSAFGYKGKSISTDRTEKGHISLACSINDSFCPYTARTLINRQLSPLIYDSLVKVDDGFTPENSLASEVKVSGTTVKVTLREAYFTDGSAVTAGDVVYCAQKAKESDTRWGDCMKSISSIGASGSTVVFTLKNHDPYAANLLDFPVYKMNTENKKSVDNISIPPIGSGMYKLNSDKSKLTVNEYYRGTKPQIKKIYLINTPDEDALTHNLETGNITYYYSDLSDCSLSMVRGNYKKVNTSNLVYLGVNMASGPMYYSEMRQAVSSALDRKKIVSSAYFENAVASSSVFNPQWQEVKTMVASPEKTANSNVYLAQLEKIGYNKKNKKGYFVNPSGETLEISLISYKGNEWRHGAAKLIKEQLKSAGIKVNLKSLSWNEYISSLKTGSFDMYISEVKLSQNMDISAIVSKDSAISYGVTYGKKKKIKKKTASQSEKSIADDEVKKSKDKEVEDVAGKTATAVANYKSGDAEISDILVDFNAELPIIPLLYRTGLVSYSVDISPIKPAENNPYSGIENAKIK